MREIVRGALGAGAETFGQDDDAVRLAPLGAFDHLVVHLVDVVAQFRQEDDVRSARHAGIERYPACAVAHDLDHHHAFVRAGG